MTPEFLGEPKRRLGRLQRVVRLERREIANEIEVAIALDVDESPHELVVGMQAARQNDR
jgi:hypothetical protein